MPKLPKGFAPLFALAFLCGCAHSNPSSPASAEFEIRAALETQVNAWNAGDLAGFMNIYAKSEQTRFASGGDISIGWQTVFDRYAKRYTNRAAMGTLTFSGIEITPLASDTALAFGKWQLQRADDSPSGLFTLIFRRMPEGWRIVHDHTSSGTK